MAIAAIAALAAAQIEDRHIARKVMVAAAVLFAVLGAVSILSIGIGFLLTVALAALLRSDFRVPSRFNNLAARDVPVCVVAEQVRYFSRLVDLR